MTRLSRVAASFLSVASLITSLASIPARADSIDAPGNLQVAQSIPIGELQAPISKPSLPRGLSYTLDTSIAYPLGNVTQGNQNARLPGGVDAVLGYGFGRHLRAQVGYYTLQEYPMGFSTAAAPVYLQGLSAPIGSTSLAGNDATVRNQILIATVQTMVQLGKVPLVISPAYVSRKGTVGGNSDLIPVEINGFPQAVHLRTFQYQLIGFTIPFLSTPRMFGTYTIAPQWLTHTSGANTKNSPQLFQLMYVEYRASDKTTFFLQPSLLQNYTPIDAYPEHIPTLIYGVTHRLDKLFYIQGQVSTGTPTNPNGGLGITSVTCQQLPCSSSQVTPSIGGLKASQIQLMLGIGKPQVLPL